MFTYNNLSKAMQLLDNTDEPRENRAISDYIDLVSSARIGLVLTALLFIAVTFNLW